MYFILGLVSEPEWCALDRSLLELSPCSTTALILDDWMFVLAHANPRCLSPIAWSRWSCSCGLACLFDAVSPICSCMSWKVLPGGKTRRLWGFGAHLGCIGVAICILDCHHDTPTAAAGGKRLLCCVCVEERQWISRCDKSRDLDTQKSFTANSCIIIFNYSKTAFLTTSLR